MLTKPSNLRFVLGYGIYAATEALRLINFQPGMASREHISRQTLSRWMRGYDFAVKGIAHHSEPLWPSDYSDGEGPLELSFRDLIELRFVRAFRDAGLSLGTIRACFARAVEEVSDPRPFSTRRFRTDGRTIFLDITRDVQEGELIDLKKRQGVFRTIVEPSFRGLEFDAETVARWFPLGATAIVIDPERSFGRPITAREGIPTEILAEAINVEGSAERVARVYEVPVESVRRAVEFEAKLGA